MNGITTNPKLHWIIIFIFFIFIPSVASAQDGDQLITINQKNITYKKAFAEIEKQTDYTIAYEQSILNLNDKISLTLKKATINIALNQILKNTPCTYKISGYHIIISLADGKSPQEYIDRPTQTIRGVVIDSKTNAPVEYAAVGIVNNHFMGAVTDSLGRFRIDNVPVGRYDVQATFMGYTPGLANSVQVTSSKEAFLEFHLRENIQSLNEIVVRPEVKKDETLNPMAITGGRMISMEEASRFANGFDDPARLSTAFAGVAGDIGSNAVSIRGNSPMFTQWRLEGVEIPNPTHFADLAGLGGGFLSALSTQVMGNSDFYNGSFPAEYNNSLSGIFDMFMRNGNNQKYEHTFQVGLMGLDLASEGPISKKHGSSYIFNYRFSTTSLATNGGANLKYQDFSFKLNFPTKRAGVFSVWGLGLRDRNKYDAEDPADWETSSDRQSGNYMMDKLIGGLTHKYSINHNTYIRSSLAASYSDDQVFTDQHIENLHPIHTADIRNSKWSAVFKSYLNKKFSSRHINRTGITITGLKYDLDYKVSPNVGLNKPMEQLSKGKGESMVLSAFSSSVINLNEKLTASLGLTTQYFTLNENWSVEPRAALKWQFHPSHSLAAAYGLQARRENLDYYYFETNKGGNKLSNKYLDFSKSHHFGLTYNWSLNPGLHLKVEPYFQYLYSIPVEENSSFSIINHNEFYLERILVNDGKAKNYGIDITLEQYMKNGFYYMLTASVFKSKYKGGDHVWRNTRYDRGFMFNALAGKEWMVGKKKQNVISVNGRLFFHGGSRYTPLDEEASLQEHDLIFDESQAFSKKFRPYINGDISASYRINRKKVSHEFSIKLLNIGFDTGMHYWQYNEKTRHITKEKGLGMIPNISYKLYF